MDSKNEFADFRSQMDSGAFESFLMRLAIDFVNMSPAQIDEGIDRALAMTGEFCGVDRAYVMAYDFQRRIVDNTHEWCAGGIVPMLGELQGVPMDGIEDEWIKVHLRGDVVHVEDVQALPADAPLRRLLEPQGIITLVAVPMSYHGNCLGFVGFDAVRQHIDWTAERLTLVRVLAELFTNAEMGRRRIYAIESERAKAETASGLLKRAVDATGTAVWEFDAGGDEVLMVSGWNRLLGGNWDGCLIPLTDFRARVHPDDLEGIDRAFDPASQSHGKHGTVEFRIRGLHHDWRVFRSWWIAEHGKNHAGTCLFGGTIDITDSVRGPRKDQILRRISSRFVDHESYHSAVKSALAEISHYCNSPATGLFIWDESCGNPAAYAAPANESARHPVLFEAWCAQMAPGTESHRLLANGECVFGRCLVPADKLATPADEPVHSVLLVPLLTGGALIGALAVGLRDMEGRATHDQMDFLRSCAEIISGAIGRLMAEDLLRENVKVQQLVLNSLSETIFLMDPQHRITFINRAGGDFFGESSPALVGRRITELPSLSNSPIIEAVDQDSSHVRRSFVLRLKNRSGEDRIVSFQHRPIVKGSEFLFGILGIITDITEQQAFEENLISEKIKAEATSDAKTLFISNFSHEIRTPMHGVLGVLELLIRSGRLDQKNKALAETAHRSGLALVRLFDDLLDIAKFERGAIKLHPTEIDLKPVIVSVAAIFQMEVEAKSLKMHLEMDGNLPQLIVIDELRLRQIVSNLLSNAVKFTEHGVIRLILGADTNKLREDILSIVVEDTGGGIPEKDMGVLFEPFVQLQTRGPNQPATGSGLGLPITKQIVQIMNGRIAIESQVGVGTKVTVLLPFETRAQSLHHVASMNGFEAGAASLSGFSVLVAENNEINRILACEHLQALGCEVVAVENGLEAVEESRSRSFDAVIMDCAMPVMDGYEAARRIIEDAGEAGGPMILGCTANASQQTVAKCLASGMRSVIVKPYTREHIRSALLSVRLSPLPDPGGAGMHPADASPDVGYELQTIDFDVLGSVEGVLGKSSPGMKRIFSVFRDSSRQQIDELSDAMKSCDWRTCQRIAHSLKGGAASIGAARLAAVCARIESACADHGGTAADRIIQAETVETLVRERSAALKEIEFRLRPAELE